MKKEMWLWLLGISLLAGCSVTVPNETVNTPAEQVSSQLEIQHEAPLIAVSDDEKVRLFARNEAQNEITEVTLDIDGKRKNFDWTIPDTGTKPQLFYTDLTNDHKEEAAIIIQTGRGTGLNHYEIHVVNGEDLSEMNVQHYEDIVAHTIESTITKKDDGTLAITMKAQGKESTFDYDFDPAPDINQAQLAFGGVVIYTVENQKIMLNIPGSIGISPIYVADVRITYQFNRTNNEFLVEQIDVKPIEK
ncbi:hypothetical protein ACIQV0_04340 [Lysinibacillus capsici]|uniref:hypothetical protein n=1 Tax=Lysinibacillus capsici TaxID=2115968 RepID=UPI002A7F565D|nr:hypothetical protein [Lysinibacillus capsici]